MPRGRTREQMAEMRARKGEGRAPAQPVIADSEAAQTRPEAASHLSDRDWYLALIEHNRKVDSGEIVYARDAPGPRVAAEREAAEGVSVSTRGAMALDPMASPSPGVLTKGGHDPELAEPDAEAASPRGTEPKIEYTACAYCLLRIYTVRYPEHLRLFAGRGRHPHLPGLPVIEGWQFRAVEDPERLWRQCTRCGQESNLHRDQIAAKCAEHDAARHART